MNDPHVEKLFYQLVIPEHTDYDNAPPISGETDDFEWHLSKEQFVIEMKTHCPTESDARDIVSEFLKRWEVSIGLLHRPDNLRFRFKTADLIDRDPNKNDAGAITLKVASTYHRTVSMDALLHLRFSAFPKPPTNFKISPEVEMMYSRYSSYRKGKESLLSMAYWCLTIVEGSTKVFKKKRITAANQYWIDFDVLDTLGKLSTEAGDKTEARKFTSKSTLAPLTQNEKNWVESVVKKLIERMAEYAYDSSAKLQQVTMSDLPSTM